MEQKNLLHQKVGPSRALLNFCCEKERLIWLTVSDILLFLTKNIKVKLVVSNSLFNNVNLKTMIDAAYPDNVQEIRHKLI